MMLEHVESDRANRGWRVLRLGWRLESDAPDREQNGPQNTENTMKHFKEEGSIAARTSLTRWVSNKPSSIPPARPTVISYATLLS